MAKIDIAALARQYLEEAARLKGKYDVLAKQAMGCWGENALEIRRRMGLFYDMYLECRATGRYLQQFVKEETHADAEL